MDIKKLEKQLKEKQEKIEKFSIDNGVKDLERVDFKEVSNTRNPIIFDTNFLFTTFSFKIDIITELQRVIGSTSSLFIYTGTIDELKAIEKQQDKNKRFLPLIIKMLHIYNFKIINSEIAYIDDQIMSNLDNKIIIATNDKELRIKIWKQRGRVLYLRQKSYLELK